MESLHAQLLVVLAPALLSVALCLLAKHAALAALMAKHVTLPMRELLTSREHVESLLSLATNLAFVGSAVGVVFGFSESSREAFLLGMVVALASLFMVSRLSRLSAELAKNEAAVAHRKMAGTVRSIVRSELQAAAARAAGPRRLSSGRYNRGRKADAENRLKQGRLATRMGRTPHQ